MVQHRSILTVADNSGARKLMVIHIVGGSKRRFGHLGDVVTAVVKGAVPQSAVKDHEIVKAVIARTKKEHRRLDGSYIRFDDNAGIVIDKEGNPRGTRVFGPIARELRDRGYHKIVSLAPEVW